MEKGNVKRVLRVELDDDVKKVSITGMNGDEKVVMKQDLNEDELDKVAGGAYCCIPFLLAPEWANYCWSDNGG